MFEALAASIDGLDIGVDDTELAAAVRLRIGELQPYFDEHDTIGIGAGARSAAFFELDETGRGWTARQVLDDPAGHREWVITAEVDLDASDEAGVAVVKLLDVARR